MKQPGKPSARRRNRHVLINLPESANRYLILLNLISGIIFVSAFHVQNYTGVYYTFDRSKRKHFVIQWDDADLSRSCAYIHPDINAFPSAARFARRYLIIIVILLLHSSRTENIEFFAVHSSRPYITTIRCNFWCTLLDLIHWTFCSTLLSAVYSNIVPTSLYCFFRAKKTVFFSYIMVLILFLLHSP